LIRDEHKQHTVTIIIKEKEHKQSVENVNLRKLERRERMRMRERMGV
jgi:hypothetical protein